MLCINLFDRYWYFLKNFKLNFFLLYFCIVLRFDAKKYLSLCYRIECTMLCKILNKNAIFFDTLHELLNIKFSPGFRKKMISMFN